MNWHREKSTRPNTTNSFDRWPIELSWQCSRVGSQCGITPLLLHC